MYLGKNNKRSIFEIVIHDKNLSDSKELVKICIEDLLDEIVSQFRTLGQATFYLPRDTLYGLKAKVGHQKKISVETVLKLSLTAGYKGFLIRRCDQADNCACKDTH